MTRRKPSQEPSDFFGKVSNAVSGVIGCEGELIHETDLHLVHRVWRVDDCGFSFEIVENSDGSPRFLNLAFWVGSDQTFKPASDWDKHIKFIKRILEAIKKNWDPQRSTVIFCSGKIPSWVDADLWNLSTVIAQKLKEQSDKL